MAETDWAILTDSVDGTEWSGESIRRGVTSAVDKPTGSTGDFVFGFHSRVEGAGAVGLKVDDEDFDPIDADGDGQGGGSIRAAMKKGYGAGLDGFSAFLFLGLQTDNVSGDAYMLGFENADPSHLVLAKGPIQNGIPTIGGSFDANILRHSVDTFDYDTWWNIRLDMIVNSGGVASDVILKAYYQEITHENDVTEDNWIPIPFNDDLDFGDGTFVDDPLEIASGSLPFATGRVGFGFQSSQPNRRAFFDFISVQRQMAIT